MSTRKPRSKAPLVSLLVLAACAARAPLHSSDTDPVGTDDSSSSTTSSSTTTAAPESTTSGQETSSTGSSADTGPVIVMVTTDATKLTAGESLMVTAVVTDADGDLSGGQLVSADLASGWAHFMTTGQPDTFSASIS